MDPLKIVMMPVILSELDPQATVYKVEVSGHEIEDQRWEETFRTEAERDAFMRGMRAKSVFSEEMPLAYELLPPMRLEEYLDQPYSWEVNEESPG